MKKIEQINKKINRLKKEILSVDYILRGSITKKYLKCGKKECICHRDLTKLHGPYYVFTKKIKGKTVTRHYTKEEAVFLKVYLKQYNEVIAKIRKFSELSEEAVGILMNQIKKNK